MNRGGNDVEDEMHRLWSLVAELSGQLASNREMVAQLKLESENVKGQVAHIGTGFPLRRFNLDISDEEFQTELEAFAAHLVLENQQLQHENRQLNALLKEYEQTLESVMGKFRSIAHASQQHDLSLHSYYTSLLQSLQTAHSTAHLHDDTSLSLLLTRLSTLLRSALRSLGGEEPEGSAELLAAIAELPQPGSASFSAHANGGSSATGAAPPSPPSPTTQAASSATTTAGPRTAVLQRAPKRRIPFAGSQHGAKGGYAGTEGQADWALEREMEILRLEEENKTLRDMLRISEEIAALEEPSKEEEAEPQESETISPSASNTGRRKSSLTLEELEAGAEHEDDARLRAQEIEQKNVLDDPSTSAMSAIAGAAATSASGDQTVSGSGEAAYAGQPSRFGAADGFETIDMSDSALLTGTEEVFEPEDPPGATDARLLDNFWAAGEGAPAEPEGIENVDQGIIKGGHGLVAPAANEAPEAESPDDTDKGLAADQPPPNDDVIDLMSA